MVADTAEPRGDLCSPWQCERGFSVVEGVPRLMEMAAIGNEEMGRTCPDYARTNTNQPSVENHGWAADTDGPSAEGLK